MAPTSSSFSTSTPVITTTISPTRQPQTSTFKPSSKTLTSAPTLFPSSIPDKFSGIPTQNPVRTHSYSPSLSISYTPWSFPTSKPSVGTSHAPLRVSTSKPSVSISYTPWSVPTAVPTSVKGRSPIKSNKYNPSKVSTSSSSIPVISLSGVRSPSVVPSSTSTPGAIAINKLLDGRCIKVINNPVSDPRLSQKGTATFYLTQSYDNSGINFHNNNLQQSMEDAIRCVINTAEPLLNTVNVTTASTQLSQKNFKRINQILQTPVTTEIIIYTIMFQFEYPRALSSNKVSLTEYIKIYFDPIQRVLENSMSNLGNSSLLSTVLATYCDYHGGCPSNSFGYSLNMSNPVDSDNKVVTSKIFAQEDNNNQNLAMTAGIYSGVFVLLCCCVGFVYRRYRLISDKNKEFHNSFFSINASGRIHVISLSDDDHNYTIP